MAFWARGVLCLCYCLLSWDAAADDEIDDGDDDEGKDGDDVDDADGYKGQQGGCRARSLWQYGLPMHRLNILNLPALKMMIPVRILMVLIMTMVLMIDDNDDDCEDVDNGDGEAAFEDLHVATKVLSVKIHFRNPSLWRSMQVIAKPLAERVSNKSIQLIPTQRVPLVSELVWTIFDALALSRLTAGCI